MREKPSKEVYNKHKQLGFAQTHADRATQSLRFMIANLNKAYENQGSNNAVKLEEAMRLIAEVKQSAGDTRHELMHQYELPY